MNAAEWLDVIMQADDAPKAMKGLIIKYGEMKVAEAMNDSKPTKQEIDFDVDFDLVAHEASCAINKIYKNEVLDILKIYFDLKYKKDTERLA